MMASSNIVSVGVEVGSSVHLFKFNKQEKLSDIIEALCTESGKVSFVENKYAFQFIRDQSNNKLATKYVTEDNVINIIDGTELKLVYSPAELSRMIHDHLRNDNSDICWALEKLAGHIDDPVFVSEVFSPCYPAVMEKINSGMLPSKLYCYCLKAILGFLKYDYIKEVDRSLIEKLLKNISPNSDSENIIIEHTFRVLEQSVAKNQYSLIANSVEIKDLFRYLWNKDAPLVQEYVLTLINNIAFYCPCDETKLNFIKQMNSCKSLSTISSNVLYQGAEPSSEMAEQLYLYQTLVFSLLSDRLDPFLLDCASLPDSELVSETKRHSNLESSASESMGEFNTESTGSSSRNSNDMSLANHMDRISNGWKSEGMYSKRSNLVLSFLNLEMSELNKEIKYLEEMPDLKTINQLVYDCIIYFSKHYRKNYQISICTEGCQNLISICYDVVNLIINNLLNVGKEPVKGSITYYPLVFSATKKQPFMEELFCVAMWLFERTKREMNSRTYEDYKKILKVMERQLKEGLSAQPKTYRELEMTLRSFTYSSVSEQWQIERKAKEQQFFKTSLAVKELRKNLKVRIIQLIKEQRLNYIMKGSKFPVWNSLKGQRVKNKFWFARLSSNQKFILYATDIEEGSQEFTDLESLPLRDVEEFVVGKKCPHLKDFKSNSKDKKDHKEIPLGFSLIKDKNLETSLDFVVNSREVYEYWVDALNTLFGNKMKSNLFKEELSTLLSMELKIQLLDVEGIDCPIEPPPIPPPPDNYDFFSE